MFKKTRPSKEEFDVLKNANESLKCRIASNIYTANRTILRIIFQNCPPNHGIALSTDCNITKDPGWKEFVKQSAFLHKEMPNYCNMYQVGTHFVSIYPDANDSDNFNTLMEILFKSSLINSQIIEDYTYFKL